MSADRELLELAAKAAGIVGKWTTGHHAYGTLYIEGIDTGTRFWWNPLTDDGDALRLASSLRLDISYQPDAKVEVMNQYEREEDVRWAWEDLGTDPYAATRRAIVRAAAEIGKAMP